MNLIILFKAELKNIVYTWRTHATDGKDFCRTKDLRSLLLLLSKNFMWQVIEWNTNNHKQPAFAAICLNYRVWSTRKVWRLIRIWDKNNENELWNRQLNLSEENKRQTDLKALQQLQKILFNKEKRKQTKRHAKMICVNIFFFMWATAISVKFFPIQDWHVEPGIKIFVWLMSSSAWSLVFTR